MSYPGNPSLTRDVQQRVLDTFSQTLDLVNEGSRQEALLGCDFVLRMDPQFEPARRLQERLRSSAGAVVDTDDLRAAVDPSAAAAATQAQVVPADLFADLDGLGLDLPDLPPTSGADLHQELNGLLEQRRFQELIALAETERATVFADPVLQGVVQEAQTRMEAEPYVKKFLASARAALQAGNADEAGRLLDKVRALDGSHPEIAELDAIRSRSAAAPAGPAATPMAAEDLLGGFDLSFDSPGIDLASPLQESAMPSLDPFAEMAPSPSSVTSEGDQRIRALLDEGQKAFDGGDLQGSIDAWSRIFLIDIDHQEASRRIEQARKLKAESERQVEEIFHDGVAKLEAGDTAAARQAFQRVLELQPGYFQAREYLQQLDAGKIPVTSAARPAPRDPMAGAPESLLHGGLETVDDLKEEILVPPDPGDAPAKKTAERRPAKVAAVRERKPGKLFALVGSVVLLIVLAGGWFVWQNKDRFFPNSQTDETPSAASTFDPVARAKVQYKAGKVPSAINTLRRVAPTDPQYQQAQELIKQWEGSAPAAAPETTSELTSGGPEVPAAPTVPPERQAALDAAHQAYSEGSYLRAAEILEQASTTGKLDDSDAGMLANAKRQIEPIARQIDLFRQHEWDFLLPDLWRMREKSPGNRDIDRLIVDSYYNLGVRDLQRADAAKAVEKFQEALNISPNDALAKRHLLFAQTYQERQKDLLYRIYVRYLAYR
jgi:tetratricopeptide (TPR) repeat protein